MKHMDIEDELLCEKATLPLSHFGRSWFAGVCGTGWRAALPSRTQPSVLDKLKVLWNEQALCQFPNGQAPSGKGHDFSIGGSSAHDFQRSLACAMFWVSVWLGGLPRISVHALVWIRAHCITSVSFCTAFPPALFLYSSFLICHASR